MLRVRINWTGLPGLPGVSTLYFTGEDAPAANGARTKTQTWLSEISVFLSTQMTATVDGLVDRVNPETGDILSFFSGATAPVIGQQVGEPLPLSTQGLIRFGTNGVVANRRVKGRMFIPGFTEPTSTNGQPAPTIPGQVGAETQDSLVVGAPEMLVWSRPTTGRPGSTHPVISATMWSQWAVLRSRRD